MTQGGAPQRKTLGPGRRKRRTPAAAPEIRVLYRDGTEANDRGMVPVLIRVGTVVQHLQENLLPYWVIQNIVVEVPEEDLMPTGGTWEMWERD